MSRNRSNENRLTRLVVRKLIAFVIGLVFSVRKTLIYTNQLDVEHPCILVGFHDEILPVIDYLRGTDSVQMVANSHVGYGLAMVLRSWGYEKIIHGSPGRSSKRAFISLLREIKKGKTAFIAPDGSRGPRHVMKEGAFFLAKQRQLPLYIVSPNYKGIRLRFFWDKFLLPLPFARVTFKYERIDIPPDSSKEELAQIRAATEKRLQALVNPL